MSRSGGRTERWCTYSFGGETVGEVSIEDVRGLPVGRRFERTLDFDREGVGMGNRRYLDGTLTYETFGGWIRYGGFAVSDVTVGDDDPPIEALLYSVSIGQGSGSNSNQTMMVR